MVPRDDRSSESCLHCEINELVQEHVEGQEKVDLTDLAARMAESLVDLVLLAPEEEQAQLLAFTIAHLDTCSPKRPGLLKGVRLRRTDLLAASPRLGRAKKMRGSAPLEIFPLCRSFRNFVLMRCRTFLS
jgi:hypothetical protein